MARLLWVALPKTKPLAVRLAYCGKCSVSRLRIEKNNMAAQPSATKLLAPSHLGWFAVWVAALFGALQIHRVSGWSGHSICGPWGCGPPIEALLSYHGFWLVLLLPAGIVAGRTLPPTEAARWGAALAIAAIVGIVTLAAVDAARWLSLAHDDAHRYLVQRCFFRLATFVDFPLVQLAVAGACCSWRARHRRRADVKADLLVGSGETAVSD